MSATRRRTALQKKHNALLDFKAGRLISSTGEIVPADRPDIALAIAHSMARKIDPTLPKKAA